MTNKLIPLALDMIASGEIGVTEVAQLAGTTHSNISHYLARRGINPRVRTDARNAWVQAAWQRKMTNLLGAQSTCTLDAVSKLSVMM